MVKMICVTGKRHVGKTTFLESLIPLFTKKGLRVAAIKYSKGTHELDTPGKNSWRLKQAGAELVTMVTPNQIAEYRPSTSPIDLSDFQVKYQEFDLIITEGIHKRGLPTIEILREEINLIPETNTDELLALVSDKKIDSELPLYNFDEADKVADLLIDSFL
jgi:molybdopterin-guanine dinucleotide biosynthesis protein B